MSALTRLSITNYKSLRRVRVQLGPLNVLVGPNESGKSNFLDVIQFLGDSVRDDLGPAIDRRDGFDRVRFRGVEGGSIEIKVEARVTQYSSDTAPDEYTLTFFVRRMKDGRQVLVRQESFTFKRTQGRGRRITVTGNDAEFIEVGRTGEATSGGLRLPLRTDSLGLSTLPRLAPEQGGTEISRMAELFSSFRVFNVDADAARRPSRTDTSARGAIALAGDASNLSAFLYFLGKEHPSQFEALQHDAREIIPGLESLEFSVVGGGGYGVVLELKERGLRDHTYLSEASFGSVRALALLAMLYDPSPPLLTCIEEMDHGLHPYAFDLLVERLREASARTQFILVTHSPALVNRIHADELIVSERDVETGESVIPTISQTEVAEIMAGTNGRLGLGEIWFTGAVGGVPK